MFGDQFNIVRPQGYQTLKVHKLPNHRKLICSRKNKEVTASLYFKKQKNDSPTTQKEDNKHREKNLN